MDTPGISEFLLTHAYGAGHDLLGETPDWEDILWGQAVPSDVQTIVDLVADRECGQRDSLLQLLYWLVFTCLDEPDRGECPELHAALGRIATMGDDTPDDLSTFATRAEDLFASPPKTDVWNLYRSFSTSGGAGWRYGGKRRRRSR